MEQVTGIISAYLFGAIALMLAVLALALYLQGQSRHWHNPFERRELAYRPKDQAHGILVGKRLGLVA